VATTRGAATERALAWTTDQLIFDKQRLSTVLAMLSRWYDLDIHAADSVVTSHLVTAHFSTQSVDEMLQALAIATEAVVERQGRRVTLRAAR
jgi:ferric-dicitrate binding protein FerR (iron transport regulator)